MLDHQDAIILATARDTTQLANTAAERTGLSRVAVSRRIKKLADASYLTRHGAGTRQTYQPGPHHFWLTQTTREAVWRSGGEFGIWEIHVSPLLQGVSDAVANLANIAFTEMLNNALDHSQAQHLLLAAHVRDGRLHMLVADDGVGIFRQIAQAMDLFDDRLALLELAKGKFTTAASGHSGMGVFVSSRMLDGMAIQSRGLTFDLKVGNRALNRFDWVDAPGYLKNANQGTSVRMDLALTTDRTAQAVYDRYFTPDEVGHDAFHTTEVPVRLAQLSSQLTSRSQGKWVVDRATQFKTVVLDFEGVTLVGQGFVDEVFRVFASAHPQVRLKPVNLVPDVARALAMFAPHATQSPTPD
jgi:anti-sigma regulatory factor (Ser/Thr protein kinase)